MPEPFGKRNRRTVSEPAATMPVRDRSRRSPAASTNPKVYLYIIGGVLFLVLTAYAFAA